MGEIVETVEQELSIADLRALAYVDYLKTPHWQRVREAALEHADYRCQLCGAQDRTLEVHHNNYERLGCERPSDVIALCDPCHGYHHEPRYHEAHFGMVCPSCTTQWVVRVSIIQELTE